MDNPIVVGCPDRMAYRVITPGMEEYIVGYDAWTEMLDKSVKVAH